jgi:Na+/H+ antiporter NhaA
MRAANLYEILVFLFLPIFTFLSAGIKRHENSSNNAIETVTTGFFEYKLPKIFIKSLLTFNCLARSGSYFGSPCLNLLGL